MEDMKFFKQKGKDGYKYIMQKEDKSLSVEAINSYENVEIHMLLKTNNPKDLTFNISPLDKTYYVFDTFYKDQKDVTGAYDIDPYRGLIMNKHDDDSYCISFNNTGPALIIHAPNYGWWNMYSNLHGINVEEKDKKDNYFVKLKTRKK